MSVKMKLARAEVTLARLLAAFEQELITASDDEIMAAAEELGMNPAMKGSAAFAGLKYPMGPRLADFYNVEAWRRGQIVDDRISTELRLNHKDNPPVQSPKSRRRKGAQDK
jgi:hypothetical protein